MQQIILPGTDIKMSRFSFGTASLFNVGSQKERQKLLAAACDNGFTHFDTAPYYGFGIAERDLKPILASHPDVTVTTKVGLYSPGGENQSATSVFIRKAAGRLFKPISRPAVDWSVARARDALSASLKRLGRERVDLYLLHEPDMHLINTEEWLRWLESEKDRVAYFGIGGDEKRLIPFIDKPNPLATVIQALDSNINHEAAPILQSGRELQMTYGYIAAMHKHGLNNFEETLVQALRRNTTGSIIVSTKKVERLPQYSKILDMSKKGLVN